MSLPEIQADKTIQDAWDYKGRPAKRTTTGGWTSATMILGRSVTYAYSFILFLLFWTLEKLSWLVLLIK